MTLKRNIHLTIGLTAFVIKAAIKPTERASVSAVDLSPVEPGAPEFTMSADYTGGGGQCQDSIRAAYAESGATSPQLEELMALWDRYHLNGMKSGTLRQQQAVKVALRDEPYTYEKGCEALQRAGLYEDRGYQYGGNWLYLPLPDGFEANLTRLLDALDGARIGQAVDLGDLPDIGGDRILADDFSERREGLRAFARSIGADPDKPDEFETEDSEVIAALDELKDLNEAADEAGSSIENGETFIAESDFDDYAKEFATDVDLIREDSALYAFVDWERFANSLKGDYTEVKIGGVAYLIR